LHLFRLRRLDVCDIRTYVLGALWVWVEQSGIIEKLSKKIEADAEARERAELVRLQAKYTPTPS